jgi:hypothetical protein
MADNKVRKVPDADWFYVDAEASYFLLGIETVPDLGGGPS